jgi:hypothetical protein
MKLVALGTVSLALLSLVTLGCSKGSGSSATGSTASATAAGANAPKGGSCMEPQAGICTNFADNPGGIAETVCTGMSKGTYGKAACSTDSSVGSCLGKDGNTVVYYFGNSVAPWQDDAAADCKSSHEGTFTATAGAADTAKQKAVPTADKIAASCVQSFGLCDDYFGDPLMVGVKKSLCSAPDGTLSDGKACSTDGLVATCLTPGKAERYYASYMKKTSTTLAAAEDQCKNSTLVGTAHFYPEPGAMVALAAKPAKGKAKAH